MVVGIYHVPDNAAPKRRLSESSASGRSPKRCREDAEVEDSKDSLPSAVVLLEDNGGIWHVDGLLELLAGALCATLGADPAALSQACEAMDGPAADGTDSAGVRSLRDGQNPQRQADPAARETTDDVSAAYPALTEGLLQFHTATSAGQLQASPARSCSAACDDDDRSSVVSLSAWVGGSHFARRRSSEGSAQIGSGGSPRASTSGAAAGGFSFAPAARAAAAGGCGGGGSFSFRSSHAAAAAADRTCAFGDIDSSRWPRRRVSAASYWR